MSASLAEEPSPSERRISFNQDVRPILSDNCVFCHGPDAEDRQADVRLDVPDEVDLDEVLDRISQSDPDLVMPPPESHKQLSDSQIDTLKRWIREGAVYEQHWAFQPVSDPDIPGELEVDGGGHSIDRFVQRRLREVSSEESSSPTSRRSNSPRADRRTLIRRVTMDLTGLPPTRAEIAAFLADESPSAFADLVDRLLERPAYGEHMARFWLDLVRFADTNGLHHDHYREMTPYRDWVIRSFNGNMPFDRFVVDQIAGDLHPSPSVDQRIASGFNRLHLIIDRGTALPEESFMRNVVDRVSSVGTAFLGLTLECAVCHDHKYDPITQRDFYQLYAFFNNFDGGPETGGRKGTDFRRGLQEPYLELPSPDQRRIRKGLEREIADLSKELKELDAKIKRQKIADETAANVSGKANGSGKDETVAARDADAHATAVTAADDEAKLVEIRKTLSKRLSQKSAARDQLLERIPAALVMKERDEIRPAYIMERGNYDQPGEEVRRSTPGFLPPLAVSGGDPSRMDLANWLTGRSQPLTARVAVNRFWQQLFGVGIVKTSEDFGAQG
ncbi:MAG: DUF1549 domain-containing protein, partial [Planctomycetota bacterium]